MITRLCFKIKYTYSHIKSSISSPRRLIVEGFSAYLGFTSGTSTLASTLVYFNTSFFFFFSLSLSSFFFSVLMTLSLSHICCRSLDLSSLYKLISNYRPKSSSKSGSVVSSSNLPHTVFAKFGKSCSFFRRIWLAVYCLFYALRPKSMTLYLRRGHQSVVLHSVEKGAQLYAFPHWRGVWASRRFCLGRL